MVLITKKNCMVTKRYYGNKIFFKKNFCWTSSLPNEIDIK